MTNHMKFILWLKAALIRALKTFAQTAAAMIPAKVTITDVSWLTVLGTAALAFVVSMLTSIAGLPEVEYETKKIEAGVGSEDAVIKEEKE